MKLSDSKKAQRRERVRRLVGWRGKAGRAVKLGRRKPKGPSRGRDDHDFLVYEAGALGQRLLDDKKRVEREAREFRLKEIERQEQQARLEAERAEAVKVFEECKEAVVRTGEWMPLEVFKAKHPPKPSRWARFKAWWRRLLG